MLRTIHSDINYKQIKFQMDRTEEIQLGNPKETSIHETEWEIFSPEEFFNFYKNEFSLERLIDFAGI